MKTKIDWALGADIRACMEFRGGQKDTLDRFPAASPQFAAMRKLAMNFRAILFGADPARLDARFTEANASGRHPIWSFAQQTQEVEAVHLR
jgi:hypothetical protein